MQSTERVCNLFETVVDRDLDGWVNRVVLFECWKTLLLVFVRSLPYWV